MKKEQEVMAFKKINATFHFLVCETKYIKPLLPETKIKMLDKLYKCFFKQREGNIGLKVQARTP